MYFDKLIWSSNSPLRKDSTYISLEYVVNDLGIFCKGEIRTDDVGFATSRIGAPLGLTAVENTSYAARSLGRVVILWNRITDLREDQENGTITVFGNAHDKIVMKYEPSMKDNLVSRIDSMRRFCASSPISDDAAAAWQAWAGDSSIPTPFAPLDALIETERLQIENRSFSAAQLDSVVIPAEAAPAEPYTEPVSEPVAQPEVTTPAVEAFALCPNCGAKPVPNARFCTKCGFKL